MASRALIEATVIRAVEAVLAGNNIEDERIECKSELFPPDRVRQLAGSANAALGEDIIWIVGIDESAKSLVAVNQDVDIADWWAQVQSKFDDGIAPDLTYLWVPVPGGGVLALHFSTDRAPYVVKTQVGGSPEREVPWRAATRTRSAYRYDLLKILLPTVRIPDTTLLSCSGMISAGQQRLRFAGQASVYVENTQNGAMVLPTHKMVATLNYLGREFPLRVRPVINATRTESGGIECHEDGAYCHRPGMMRLDLDGDLETLESDTPDRLAKLETAGIRIELGVVGGSRPIRVDAVLYSTRPISADPTLRVDLDTDALASRPKDPPGRVLSALKRHFENADARPLTADQISVTTGLDQQTTQNALKILSRMNKIQGLMVAELDYPVAVTDVTWD